MKNKNLLISLVAAYICILLILIICLLCYLAMVFTPNSKISQNNSTQIAGINEDQMDDSIDGQSYRVIDVVDGDTIKIDYNGTKETIRLIGVDTPESVDPKKYVQCFAIEASNKTKELMLNKDVIIEFDESQGERDKYGRMLLYVYLKSNGEMLNEKLIEEGYAFEYTYNKPYKYQNDFKNAEEFARENQKGLWNPSTCNGEVKSVIVTPTQQPISTPIPTPTPKPPAQSNNPPVYNPPAPPPVSPLCQYSCAGSDRDCSDFTTQSQAQTFFNCCGFSAGNDPMRLDKATGVGNGIACESLP